MSVDYIFLNKKKISFDDIKAGSTIGGTEFESSTLDFCQKWLNNQQAFELKTSGSTGEPKTILVSRSQMCLSAQQTINYFGLKVEDSVLVCLNTAYIAGIMMLVRGFESGATIIAVEPSSNPLLSLERKIDFLAIVPLQLQNILDNEHSKKAIENCRATIVGGAPVSVKYENKIRNSSATIYATFGMTETLTHFAIRQLNPTLEKEFTVLEKTSISQNDDGCLVVTSPVTKNIEIVTNDLVELSSNNTFKWLGRIDNVINSGGVKIQVEKLERKIEELFYRLDISNRFFIGAKADDRLGEEVILYIEAEKELDVLANLSWSDYVDPYEKPRDIIYKSKFNETPTGKINRTKSS